MNGYFNLFFVKLIKNGKKKKIGVAKISLRILSLSIYIFFIFNATGIRHILILLWMFFFFGHASFIYSYYLSDVSLTHSLNCFFRSHNHISLLRNPLPTHLVPPFHNCFSAIIPNYDQFNVPLFLQYFFSLLTKVFFFSCPAECMLTYLHFIFLLSYGVYSSTLSYY